MKLSPSGVGRYVESTIDALRLLSISSIENAIDLVLDAYASGGRIYIMGNGGSATTATHMACDLIRSVEIAEVTRRRLRAFALTDNAAVLTRCANDTAYELVFSEQLKALADPGDLVIAISVSGCSSNVIAGLREAATSGSRTLGLFGSNAGPALQLVDVAIQVRSNDLGQVETAHLAVVHALADEVRRRVGASGRQVDNTSPQSYGDAQID